MPRTDRFYNDAVRELGEGPDLTDYPALERQKEHRAIVQALWALPERLLCMSGIIIATVIAVACAGLGFIVLGCVWEFLGWLGTPLWAKHLLFCPVYLWIIVSVIQFLDCAKR